jgi:glyceraldehyde 3-phosphate dehydrogenase
VVGVNDLLDNDYLSYMLKYDSVHGRFGKDVLVEGNNFVIDGKKFVLLLSVIQLILSGVKLVQTLS